MLAQKDNAIKETCETVYKFNQDDSVRYWCEMRELQAQLKAYQK